MTCVSATSCPQNHTRACGGQRANGDAKSYRMQNAAISFSLSEGLQLKPEQRKALRSVLNRNVTIVVFPTGFGKSFVYLLLPFSFLINARTQTASDGLYGEKKYIALSSIDFDTARSATALYQGRVQKSLRCVSHCCMSATHCHMHNCVN